MLDLEAVEQSGNKDAKIYRDAPLDTTGLIAFSGDPALDGPVRDAPEMLRRLAESDRVRQIFIRHVFRYFLGRNETPGDAVSLQEAEQAYLDKQRQLQGAVGFIVVVGVLSLSHTSPRAKGVMFAKNC